MKRILLTSGMVLCVSIPTYATGSGFTQSESTATGNALTVSNACVEPRLGVYEGPTTLNAVWNPNTINITWDDNGATTAHTGGDTSCVYDNSVTLPTPPQRIGFIFRGWGVGGSSSVFDLSTLDASIEGTSYGYVLSNGDTDNLAAYGLTTSDVGKWGALFSYGKVIGESYCSGKGGNNHHMFWGGNSSDWTATESEITSASGDKEYCWCHVTGYVAGDTNTTTLTGNVQPVSSAPWVYYATYGNVENCFLCALWCSSDILEYSGLRRALLGQSN